MNHISAKPTASGLDVMAYLVSFLSILGSAMVATWLLPNASTGIHGATPMLVLIVILCQLGGLVLAVGVPVLIQAAKQRLHMCRTAVIALGVAVLGIAAEGIALAVIPTVTRC